MKNALIIHDSYTNPDAYWYPKVAQELRAIGYEVFIPRFPTPEHQSLEHWTTLFQEYTPHINSETVLIGHSIGSAFILRQLEKMNQPIAGCVLVSPFIEFLEHEGMNLVSATFITQPFDWYTLNQSLHRVVVLGSDDDPFIPLDRMHHVAELLGTTLTIIPNAGHFTDEDTIISPILSAVQKLVTPLPSPEEHIFSDLNIELKNAGIDMTIASSDTLASLEQGSNKDEQYTISPQKNLGMETMYEDIAHTITTSSAKTMADILHQEREREAIKKIKKQKNISHIFLMIVSLICIVIGIILVQKARTYEPEKVSITETALVLPTPFRVDESILFNLSTYSSVFQTRDGLQELLKQHHVPSKTILHIYPGIQRLGVGTLAPLADFLNSFEITLPPILQSSLKDSFTYGVYGGVAEQSLFLVLDITSIDESFVGMKEWESTLVSDLSSLLKISDLVRQPSLYDRDFNDEVLLNTPMRVLRAPTVQKNIITEIRKEKIKQIPQHALPDATLASITTITPHEIIFTQPDAFLSDLAIGDIITADTNNLSAAFIRRIDNFVRTEENFKIITTTLSLADIQPTLPQHATIVRRVGESGQMEKYIQYKEQVTTYTEGDSVPVIYYAFLGNTHIVITTGLDAIEAIIQRLGEVSPV